MHELVHEQKICVWWLIRTKSAIVERSLIIACHTALLELCTLSAPGCLGRQSVSVVVGLRSFLVNALASRVSNFCSSRIVHDPYYCQTVERTA